MTPSFLVVWNTHSETVYSVGLIFFLNDTSKFYNDIEHIYDPNFDESRYEYSLTSRESPIQGDRSGNERNGK